MEDKILPRQFQFHKFPELLLGFVLTHPDQLIQGEEYWLLDLTFGAPTILTCGLLRAKNTAYAQNHEGVWDESPSKEFSMLDPGLGKTHLYIHHRGYNLLPANQVYYKYVSPSEGAAHTIIESMRLMGVL